MTALWAEGCGIALSGDEHEVSVTGFTFSAIWHDRHSADWLAALATPIRLRRTSPYAGGRIKHREASLRKRLYSKHGLLCPRLRGWQRNWIHRGALRPANPVTCFPPGKVVAPATKGGNAFPRPSGRLYGFPAAAGGISNSPLNQPALWAEPIVRCAAHER